MNKNIDIKQLADYKFNSVIGDPRIYLSKVMYPIINIAYIHCEFNGRPNVIYNNTSYICYDPHDLSKYFRSNLLSMTYYIYSANEEGNILQVKKKSYIVNVNANGPFTITIKNTKITQEISKTYGLPIKTVLSLFRSDMERVCLLIGYDILMPINIIRSEFYRNGIPLGESLERLQICCCKKFAIQKLGRVGRLKDLFWHFNGRRPNNQENEIDVLVGIMNSLS